MKTSPFDLLLIGAAREPQRIPTLLQLLHRSENGCYASAVKKVLAMPPEEVKALCDQIGAKPQKASTPG
jgi:hypothetical protein